MGIAEDLVIVLNLLDQFRHFGNLCRRVDSVPATVGDMGIQITAQRVLQLLVRIKIKDLVIHMVMIEMNAAKCLGRRHIKFGLVLGNSVVLSIHRILFRQELVVCDGIHPRLGISSSNLLFKMYITYSVLFREISGKGKILPQFIQGKKVNPCITERRQIIYGKLNGRQELIQPV